MLGQSGAVKERERDALHDTVKSGGGAGGVLYTAEFDSPEGGGESFRGLSSKICLISTQYSSRDYR
jgi:hypothetical protein